MNCIIIDDELNAIKSLRWEIENYLPDLKVTDYFDSAQDALNFLKNNNAPDIVFLDIEMPEMNGFDFINNLEKRDFEIIFTTAYSQFALEALKKEAADYLLKPIDSDDLLEAVEKVKKRKAKQVSPEDLSKTLTALKNYSKPATDKIKLFFEGKINFLKPEEIIYVMSDGNYSKLYLQTGKVVLLSMKLKDVENELTVPLFFRTHKSYLINIQKITSFYKNENFIILNDKINIPLARSKKNEFIQNYL